MTNSAKLSRPNAPSATDTLRCQPLTILDPARMAAFPPTIANTAPMACTHAVPFACDAGPLWKAAISRLPTAFAAARVTNSPALRASTARTVRMAPTRNSVPCRHERGVHQPGQRRIVRRYPEIADEVVRVAVVRPKSRCRNAFQCQIPEPRRKPGNGRAHAPATRGCHCLIDASGLTVAMTPSRRRNQ